MLKTDENFMNKAPRVACINDISGFGRCSLTTTISILSVCGIQPCPAPTAILSRHTGFSEYFFDDFADKLSPYLKNWNGIEFDGIYSGFLGSAQQIAIVSDYIDNCTATQKKPPLTIIDAVMGDCGKLYSTYTIEMCEKMRHLVCHADIITPNVTEACLLTDTEYKGEYLSDSQARELALRLTDMGSKSVVITGIRRGDNIINFSYENNEFHESEIHCISRNFSGTGDIFASVVCACVINGHSLKSASEIAGNFVHAAAQYTIDVGAPISEGVVFEPWLNKLYPIICKNTNANLDIV